MVSSIAIDLTSSSLKGSRGFAFRRGFHLTAHGSLQKDSIKVS
jgi:hypothetical protein